MRFSVVDIPRWAGIRVMLVLALLVPVVAHAMPGSTDESGPVLVATTDVVWSALGSPEADVPSEKEVTAAVGAFLLPPSRPDAWSGTCCSTVPSLAPAGAICPLVLRC